MGTTAQKCSQIAKEMGYDLAIYQAHIKQNNEDESDYIPYYGEDDIPDEEDSFSCADLETSLDCMMWAEGVE